MAKWWNGNDEIGWDIAKGWCALIGSSVRTVGCVGREVIDWLIDGLIDWLTDCVFEQKSERINGV